MMNKRWQRGRSVVRIEVTALVDVVLLLLIFFMVSTRLVPEFGFELHLPLAENPAAFGENQGALRVQVDARDRYFLDGEPVPGEALAERISAADASDVLLIEADENASHGGVMQVLDAARDANLSSVHIAAQPEQNSASD